MKKIFLFLFITNILLAQQAYIADFYNNKDGAISITFDDASYGQYEYAFPILNKYKFKATFSVVGKWIDDTCGVYSENGNIFYKRLSKKNVYSLWAKGNEIAWHGLEHIAYSSNSNWNMLDKQLRSELKYEKFKFKPIKIHTLFYPYSKTKGKVVLATKSSGFLFGRTGGNNLYNIIGDIDYYLLNSFAVYNNTNPDSMNFLNIINGSKGKWCILLYHHIILDNSKQQKIFNRHNIQNTYAITPHTFNLQMEIISKKNYWVSTIYNIGRYLLQKENSELIITVENDRVFATINCSLDNKIYNHEMTII